jgi:hypothetical protein
LQSLARELAQVADQQRQDDSVVGFEKNVERLSREIIEGWVKACRDAYELLIATDEAIHSGNLAAEHRGRILGANER